jgi:hypothetical protein
MKTQLLNIVWNFAIENTLLGKGFDAIYRTKNPVLIES